MDRWASLLGLATALQLKKDKALDRQTQSGNQ